MSETLLHIDTLFTDIFGYTVLMSSDEDLAFEALRKNREIHQLLKKNNGDTSDLIQL